MRFGCVETKKIKIKIKCSPNVHDFIYPSLVIRRSTNNKNIIKARNLEREREKGEKI